MKNILILGLLLVLTTVHLGAADPPEPEVDLTSLDLADLMEIEVTSAAKKQQPLRDVAAAIHIITQEDLRRSGATNIPEALRLVPGLDVAQLTGSIWAVSSRGFNLRFANKMLVLMDGRSLYTPLFAGVFWDVQDTMIDDIERIEVIRGPGATLWGANAVNGVINIITKPAAETQGTQITANAGNEDVRGAVRHGGRLGGRGHFRVYAKQFDVDDQARVTGGDASDGWDLLRGGFRMDWSLDRGDVTLQGDVYDGETVIAERFPDLVPPYFLVVDDRNRIDGLNLLGRWTHRFDDGSEGTIQAYFDRTDRQSIQVGEVRETVDLEVQHRFGAGDRHELLWGAGFRHSTDDITSSAYTFFDPAKREDRVFSGFLQDNVRLAGDRFHLTYGVKVEHNEYSGWEVQPNVRGLWALDPRKSLWGAISRAIRSPARAFSDVRADLAAFPDPLGTGPVNLVRLFGSESFDSEELTAYEVGYRFCPSDRSCLDAAAFFNSYDDLTSVESGMPFLETDPVPHVVVPQVLGNRLGGETYGIELSYSRLLTRRLRLHAWYALLRMDIRADAGSTDASGGPEGMSPRHQAYTRFSMDLPQFFELDLSAYYRDDLSSIGVEDFTRVDTRLAWSQAPGFEAAIVFQNMLDERHLEFAGDQYAIPTEVERRVFGSVTWTF